MTKKIDVDALKDKINFFDLASYFGERKLKVSYNSVSMCCPFHENDDTPSFFYSIEKKVGYCFSCHKSASAIDYAMHKMKTSKFIEAVDFLLKFCGLEKDSITCEFQKKENITSQLYALKKYEKQDRPAFDKFSEQDIKAFVSMRGDFFKDRGFSQETLDFFEVGFDPQQKRVVIPLRDIDGNLIGLTGRTIIKDFKEQGIVKWFHYPGSNVSDHFFNLNNALKYAKEKNNSIILCEGPADAMWLWQNDFRNIVALTSNNISKIKKKILLNHFMTIYLFLDGDNGGKNGVSSIMDEIGGYFSVYNVVCESGKDPDNFNKEQLTNLMASAKKLC